MSAALHPSRKARGSFIRYRHPTHVSLSDAVLKAQLKLASVLYIDALTGCILPGALYDVCCLSIMTLELLSNTKDLIVMFQALSL